MDPKSLSIRATVALSLLVAVSAGAIVALVPGRWRHQTLQWFSTGHLNVAS